jgi:hypothetical protein
MSGRLFFAWFVGSERSLRPSRISNGFETLESTKRRRHRLSTLLSMAGSGAHDYVHGLTFPWVFVDNREPALLA